MTKKSSFVKALGNAPVIRVLDFFIENIPFDYSKSGGSTRAEEKERSPQAWLTLFANFMGFRI